MKNQKELKRTHNCSFYILPRQITVINVNRMKMQYKYVSNMSKAPFLKTKIKNPFFIRPFEMLGNINTKYTVREVDVKR